MTDVARKIGRGWLDNGESCGPEALKLGLCPRNEGTTDEDFK